MTDIDEISRPSAIVPGHWLRVAARPESCEMLTIITVVRREPDRLRRTLLSLIAAGLDACELIVIEGDGQDQPESRKIRAWARTRFPNLQWLLSADGGVYDAMNRGCYAARGEWLWFLNAGDSAACELPSFGLVSELARVDEDWVVASARLVEDGRASRIKGSGLFDHSLLRNGKYMPCHQAVLVRRTALAALSGFDVRYQIAADFHMILRLMQNGRPHLWEQVIVDFEVGGMSTTRWRRLAVEAFAARMHSHSGSSRVRLAAELPRLGLKLLVPKRVHVRRASNLRRSRG